jgi:hypothetical protein
MEHDPGDGFVVASPTGGGAASARRGERPPSDGGQQWTAASNEAWPWRSRRTVGMFSLELSGLPL